MNREELITQIHRKKSFLCVGLDTDLSKIPEFILDYEDPIFEFNRRIIDSTKDFAVAYKPNIAFYESMGYRGWISLKKTLDYIPKDIFTIADAKRGDIGNTGKMYAKTYFETFDFDSVTVSPYMGSDSVSPFLEYKNKWVVLLALTSNKGGGDFQMINSENGHHLYEYVIAKSQTWSTSNNMMYVVGATQSKHLNHIRKLAPDHFLLVPGVGAQGGNLDSVMNAAFITGDCGLLVNSSRGIIYAGGQDEYFQEKVRDAAISIQKQMEIKF